MFYQESFWSICCNCSQIYEWQSKQMALPHGKLNMASFIWCLPITALTSWVFPTASSNCSNEKKWAKPWSLTHTGMSLIRCCAKFFTHVMYDNSKEDIETFALWWLQNNNLTMFLMRAKEVLSELCLRHCLLPVWQHWLTGLHSFIRFRTYTFLIFLQTSQK